MRKAKPKESLDFEEAAHILEAHWQTVVTEASSNPSLTYAEQHELREAIRASVNHAQVSYRFCLPIQLLGKMLNPALDCLRRQKRKHDPKDISSWDARSLGRRVVAPFDRSQENILGTSADPHVGNPMRIPWMLPDDPGKKDVPG
jgi:hypothetical protein